MTDPQRVATSASALRIVLAAERLFALDGIDGVSLRTIALEAGSSNNSAVHYYFGSKGGLIGAIFEHRLPQLVSERRLLGTRCDPDDVRSRFAAHYLPVLTLAEAPDCHYVSFVEQLQRRALASPERQRDLPHLPVEGQESHEEFRRDLERLIESPRPASAPPANRGCRAGLPARRSRPRPCRGRRRRAPGLRALRRLIARRHHRLLGGPCVRRIPPVARPSERRRRAAPEAALIRLSVEWALGHRRVHSRDSRRDARPPPAKTLGSTARTSKRL